MAQTKADRSFNAKLKELTGPARLAPEPLPPGFYPGRRPLDTDAVAKLFGQYGTYLELVGEDQPAGAERWFQWPPARPAEPEPETSRCTVEHGDWTGVHERIDSCPAEPQPEVSS